MRFQDDDYYIAAISDAVAGNMTLVAVDVAYRSTANAEQFFWAVHTAIMLAELLRSN